MPWFVWAMIAYYVIDRISTVLYIGRDIEVTMAGALASLVSGGLMVWAILTLANG